MNDALAEFLRHLALEKNASPHTVKSYREDLTQALEFFRGRLAGRPLEPGQLTTRLLRPLRSSRHSSRVRSAVRAILASRGCGRSPMRFSSDSSPCSWRRAG